MIIPHYNDHARLARCLDALKRDHLARPTEILVVDNNSDQPLDDILSAHQDARLVVEPKPGAATARNAGVAQSTAPRIFFLDADCVPDPDWIDQAYRAIEGQDIVGGKISVFDETPPPRSGSEAFETVFGFYQERYITEMQFSVTANLLTWRHVWDDVGPLIHGLSEDREWCNRAVGKGFRLVYDPELAVSHPSRSDWPALRKKWRRLTMESYALGAPTLTHRIRWILRAGAVLFSVLPHAPKVLGSKDLDTWQERLRGLGTLTRLRALRCLWMLRQSVGLPVPP
ncbi:MAG: glycosyltransferase [Pseudomonadota bacterium]